MFDKTREQPSAIHPKKIILSDDGTEISAAYT